MPSYNKSFNFRNGVQVDDDNFIVNPNGLVGIGTSIPTEFLDVHGTAKITGLVTARNLAVTGVSTFYSDVKIGSGITFTSSGEVRAGTFFGSAAGLTGIFAISTSGWYINAGNISTTSKVGIGTTLPSSQLDVVGDVKVSGIVTALGFGGYQVLVGTESSAIKTFSVKVASKTSNHRHTGSGSANAYFIDGIESPFLTILPGKTYRFDQSDTSNSGNRLSFYLEADRTTVYDTNVTTSPQVPGTSGSYTQITVTDTTPVVLHYQSLSSAYMGNAAQFNSNIVNTPYQITTLAGISVTTGVVTAYSFSGFGTNIQGINATNITNGTLSNSRLPQSISITGILTASSGIITSLTSINLNNTGIATLGITSISNLTVGGGVTINSNLTVGSAVTINSSGIFAPTGIITAPTFVGGLVGIASTARDLTSNARVNIADIQSQTSSIGISTVSTRLYAESIGVGTNFPSSNIHIRRSSSATLQVTSDTAEAIIAVGRSTSLIGSNGALIFGNTSGLYPYSNSKTLDIVNYDTGNINNYLQLNSAGTTGSFNWFHGPSASNLMTLTHAGNLGLGITLPTNKLHVVGISTVTEDSYVGNDLYVNNDLIVNGSFIPNGDISANLTGNVTGNVTGNLTGNVNSTGISTFNDILVSSIGIGTGTARSGLDALESGAIFGNIGIGTATIADEDTNLYVVGNSEFYGDVSVSGILTASINFLQSGTGAVSRSVDSKLKDVVSVKDFGAVGNGGTDDTVAIQAAINTGKNVFFPDGIYRITSVLTLSTADQEIDGGHSTLRKVYTDTDGRFFVLNGATRSSIKNFRIHLTRDDQSDVTGHVFDLNGSNDVLISDILVTDIAGLIKLGSTTKCARCTLQNVSGTANPDNNVDVVQILRATSLRLLHVHLTGSGSNGISTGAYISLEPLELCDTFFFDDTHFNFETGREYGMRINITQGSIVNLWSSNSTSDSTSVAAISIVNSGASANEFRNGYISQFRADCSKGGYGVKLSNGSSGNCIIKQVMFTACRFSYLGDSVVNLVDSGTGASRLVSEFTFTGCLFQQTALATIGAAFVFNIDSVTCTGCIFGFGRDTSPPVSYTTNAFQISGQANHYTLTGNSIYCPTKLVSYVGTFSTPSVSRVIANNTFADGGTPLATPLRTTLTIASDAISVVGQYHSLETEGAAATDDLSTINGGFDGYNLYLRTQNDSRDVVVKNGVGNIYMDADVSLTSRHQVLHLIYDGARSAWYRVQ